MFKNPESTEIQNKLIIWGINTTFVIYKTSLSILCIQGTKAKALLKVINVNLVMKIKNSLVCSLRQDGI